MQTLWEGRIIWVPIWTKLSYTGMGLWLPWPTPIHSLLIHARTPADMQCIVLQHLEQFHPIRIILGPKDNMFRCSNSNAEVLFGNFDFGYMFRPVRWGTYDGNMPFLYGLINEDDVNIIIWGDNNWKVLCTFCCISCEFVCPTVGVNVQARTQTRNNIIRVLQSFSNKWNGIHLTIK